VVLLRKSARSDRGRLGDFGQIRPVSIAWFGDRLIFSTKQGDSSNLWTGTLSPGTRRLSEKLLPLTLGSGNEASPSVSATGNLVFASHNYSAGIWEAVPRKDAFAGQMRPLTQNGAKNYRPTLSDDGEKLAYVSDRTGRFEVWVRDFKTGKEAALRSSATQKIFPAISRDGKQVAFWDGTAIFVGAASGGTHDWSPDAKLVQEPLLDEDSITVKDPAASLPIKIVADERLHTTAPHLSPDGKWLAFHTVEVTRGSAPAIGKQRQIFVVPFVGAWTPRSTWMAVTDGQGLDREAKWAPDGNRIYFLPIVMASGAFGLAISTQARNSRGDRCSRFCTYTTPPFITPCAWYRKREHLRGR